MKNRNSLFILAAFAAPVILGSCQTTKPVATTTQQTITNTESIAQVKQVLQEQAANWSAGDLEGYMQGYWKSDSLLFIGKSGLTYGWQQTLDNYKRSYPDVSAMGKLTFDLKEVRPLSEENILVVGKWHLQREEAKGNLEGHFSVIFQRFSDGWKILADHSS
ncbi:nuclear transport factor 2 family protein [Pontibacter sp. KCTC 32443]|uniref:YybH family protein n=1 Tax=Pontibacter TaxID=323449 RepID=UPI00164E5314|nr:MULTISPECIES: nuclear transport factor 2 family protein [Pontibacter]MBC5773273.1 nuclear transport factor 2 family protein [Pontibacter sp. KCTC 32443]